MRGRSPDSEIVLIWTPSGRDASTTATLLDRDGLLSQVCADVEAVCAAIERGAAAVLLSEDVLTPEVFVRLMALLSQQPPWSDFPILVFSTSEVPRARGAHDAVRALGNVTFLDRPVHVRSMLAAVHAAVRGRRRQYAARRAIESRDEFLAMLGHELRNPLGAIRLAGELLGRPASEEQRAKQRTIIERQTRHLARLVDDLLDVARVTYGKVTLRLEPLSVAEILSSCFQAFEPAAKTHRLAYTLRIDDPAVLVSADRDRLQQIFGNLLNNAIKYTPPEGSVQVNLSATGSECVLSVADSGVGISADMLPNVFELFSQADRSLDRSHGGMGLGLTLVRNLLHLHGGSVEAFSAGIGQGSEFCVRLPLLVSDAVAVPQPPRPNRSTSVRRIVIVEDNDDLRIMQEQLLLFAGHEVHAATSGPAGVSKILEIQPDVAFVDVGLPGFDGFELARRVRAASVAPILLIAVSGYGQVDDKQRAWDAGFDNHLTKPVGLEDFVASMALPSRSGTRSAPRASVSRGQS
jgi:signal transduction histidine kinase/ActR/RegA family two-component response regulator